MSLAILEVSAAILTFLMALEMWRQRVPWQRVVIRSVIAFGVLTAIIVAWRGV